MLNFCRTVAIVVLLVLAGALLLCPYVLAENENSGWSDASIGAPAAGSHRFQNGSMTIEGAGTGAGNESDQLHFVFQTVPAGDIELVARLSSLSDTPHARAGLMLRGSSDPAATIGQVAYSVGDWSGLRNGFYHRARDLSAAAGRHTSGGHSSLRPPLWLKICRVGREYGVYKSPDGKLWTQVQNRVAVR